jgi:hypothetical protein
MRKIFAVFLVLALVVILSSTYVPTVKGANEKLHFCHNDRFICTDEDNEIQAHEIHVTNGINCFYLGVCTSGGVH